MTHNTEMGEWEKEFDRLTNAEKCFPQESLLSSAWKDDEFLKYPESEYELEPKKVKNYIRKLLTTHRQQLKEEILAKIPKAKKQRGNAHLTYVKKVNCGVRNWNSAITAVRKIVEEC